MSSVSATEWRARDEPAFDMDEGRVRYARNGDARLAYRVCGKAEPTLVFVMGSVLGTVDTVDQPTSPYLPFLDALLPRARVVLWDRRGNGLSDPVRHIPSLDERVGDLRAVLDAAGIERAVLFGSGEGGPVGIQFAATHPERVHSLVLAGTAARFTQDLPDFPWGFTEAQLAAQLDDIDIHWGEGALAELVFGSTADVPGVREEFGRLQRSVSSPTLARMLWQGDMEVDVRDVLGDVHAPTLVLARPGNPFVPFEASAALAAGIADAQLRTLPPGEHHAFDIADVLLSEVFDFVGGKPSIAKSERVLITALFTDIVGSTELVSARGDTHWSHQLNIHDMVVDGLLAKHGGRRAKHTGDGVFAVFDGPTKAARCGLELVTALATRGIRIRAGVHAGECERRGAEWSGLAVHVGARVAAMAGPGEVLTSRTVRDLSAGSDLDFEHRGAHRLKGLPEDTTLYRVMPGGPARSGTGHLHAAYVKCADSQENNMRHAGASKPPSAVARTGSLATKCTADNAASRGSSTIAGRIEHLGIAHELAEGARAASV
jgi:class 3 adenylate cyclase/pimeloyl-ACP methyl ester carboxylesterase